MRSVSHPFGMLMPNRSYSAGAYRFGFNTQEKDDEICGAGNTNTAMFWEYSTRLGRRWNIDPAVKSWESGYSSLSNNPVWYDDPLGLEVINAHKKDKEKAEAKLKTAKDKLNLLTKEDKEYKAAKKEEKQAQRDFKYYNSKYQHVESLINEVKEKDPGLFNEADNLKDPGGNVIDIYIYDVADIDMQRGSKYDFHLYGYTTTLPNGVQSDYENKYPVFFRIKSPAGDNTATIKMSDIAKGLHLAHEFGHAIYQVENMLDYLKWLEANPKEQNKGGHGKGDPSGKAATDAEKNFK